MIITQEVHDIDTATGPMRTYLYRPDSEGQFATIIFYSEIFQQTAPIARAAAILAGHGFVVLVPEVFHELNPIGTVLEYDDVGKDKGNADKFTKPLEQHDTDTEALVDFARSMSFCSSNIGSMGVCIGGHLAYRAALNPDIQGAFCLYPTDIHSNTLPCNQGNDSLSRTGEIAAELILVFGKQDPHVSGEGRKLIYDKLEATDRKFNWLEVNAQHAFMRDEGDRYDPALALQMYLQAVAFFQRTLK
ncbi:dienelactone hydrolase family protein [Shewanella fidelis]|uniref:Dienelactone hydrolase family protein n=1 Tax=Shewanella fidelis TaxID=173509 RepID=A0AAW8NQV3_9GAMM|nr:dienelactone hydrolase family protein [Shewanella fidelis]MDR8525087.1 dienelactone hydrolase family protein [Shewanella fidelis]MDW4811158.1 dienelactone hydrolase family protein [Shewanella fidelis]MDW4815063.1 dienelactone hydrolase family protein [Shewanella fidelis]MDW4819153.1 dienelactone hydrolase family protein [Shewanella fidelis]MDW4823169.1 dienelactone hydrolase family protein [Shewanella fidelis]